MIFIRNMIINKLTSNVKIPYKLSKGSHKQRQIKSDILTDNLFKHINGIIKDNNSAFSYMELQRLIQEILPYKNLNIIVKNMEKESSDYDAICEVLYNANKEIKAICIKLGGGGNYVESKFIPTFMHEFQHVADDIFHPKFLSRLQTLNKKNYANEKYDKFYDKYYYGSEFIEGKQDKKNVLKLIKHKTQKFLKGLNTEDKINYIQDIRYSLMSEIEAYKRQIKVAKELKSKGITINELDFEDYPKEGLFEDKINLLKSLAIEYISKERIKNASRIKKKK